jgi:hypothetical protein
MFKAVTQLLTSFSLSMLVFFSFFTTRQLSTCETNKNRPLSQNYLRISRSSLVIISIDSTHSGRVYLSLIRCRIKASTAFSIIELALIHGSTLGIVASINRRLLLLSLHLRRKTLVPSEPTNKVLLVWIIARRSVVVIILNTTGSPYISSLVIGHFLGRIVGMIILNRMLILGVSIRMVIHHHVRLILINMTVIALIIGKMTVLYIIKVPLITIISIVSIILIWHHSTMKRLHLSATGVVVIAIVGITAWGKGVVPPIVNLGFTCLDFTTLAEDNNYSSLAWNFIKEGVGNFLSIDVNEE